MYVRALSTGETARLDVWVLWVCVQAIIKMAGPLPRPVPFHPCRSALVGSPLITTLTCIDPIVELAVDWVSSVSS